MEQGEQKDNNVTRFKIKFIFLEYRRIIRFLLLTFKVMLQYGLILDQQGNFGHAL